VRSWLYVDIVKSPVNKNTLFVRFVCYHLIIWARSRILSHVYNKGVRIPPMPRVSFELSNAYCKGRRSRNSFPDSCPVLRYSYVVLLCFRVQVCASKVYQICCSVIVGSIIHSCRKTRCYIALDYWSDVFFRKDYNYLCTYFIYLSNSRILYW
jgi:hypothetical protein